MKNFILQNQKDDLLFIPTTFSQENCSEEMARILRRHNLYVLRDGKPHAPLVEKCGIASGLYVFIDIPGWPGYYHVDSFIIRELRDHERKPLFGSTNYCWVNQNQGPPVLILDGDIPDFPSLWTNGFVYSTTYVEAFKLLPRKTITRAEGSATAIKWGDNHEDWEKLS